MKIETTKILKTLHDLTTSAFLDVLVKLTEINQATDD